MKRIAAAALLLLFLATTAEAVDTSITVATPAGPPLGNATIQITNPAGDVVAEEKTDEDGVVVFDLPEGNYTATTVDGAHSVEVQAGAAVSFTLPLFYGILDNVEALTEYFREFQGSVQEYNDALAALDDDVADQVQARLDDPDLFAEPGDEPGGAADTQAAGAAGAGGDTAAAAGGGATGIGGTTATTAGGASNGAGGTTATTAGGASNGAGGTTATAAGGAGNGAGGTTATAAGGAGNGAGAAAAGGGATGGGRIGQEVTGGFLEGDPDVPVTGPAGNPPPPFLPPATTPGGPPAGAAETAAGGAGGDESLIGLGGSIGTIPSLEYELNPGSPTDLNPPGLQLSENSAVQRMVVEISIGGGPITVPPTTRVRSPAAGANRRAPRFADSLVALWGVLTGRRLPAFAMTSTAVVNATLPIGRAAGGPTSPGLAAGGAQDTPTPESLVQMFLTNQGNSTGEAFVAQVVNRGPVPVTLDGGPLVVEPLAEEAQRRIQEQLGAIGNLNPQSLNLNAYCLEFLRLPPAPGMVYRIAASPIQERFTKSVDILSSARGLFDAGELNPDVAPDEYLHSIRQWAIWTEEQGFDKESFIEAFIEHTRKNLEASGRQWDDRFAETLRGALDGRWADIQRILETADR